MILSDLNNMGHFNKTVYKSRTFKTLVLGTGLYLGSYPTGANVGNSVYKYIETADFGTVIFYHITGAFTTMIVLLNSDMLQKFFSLKTFECLGKLSFSLYLIHLIIIGSFTSYIFIRLNEHMTYSVSVVVSVLLSVPPIVILSYLMYKYVDKKGIELANNLYRNFFQKNKY